VPRRSQITERRAANRDVKVTLQSCFRNWGRIAIEFRPQGAFSIFGVPMSATSNRLWETDDVFGPWRRAVEDRINNVVASVRFPFLQYGARPNV
jgi:hypothetical protein